MREFKFVCKKCGKSELLLIEDDPWLDYDHNYDDVYTKDLCSKCQNENQK